jgi:hypothetical protein
MADCICTAQGRTQVIGFLWLRIRYKCLNLLKVKAKSISIKYSKFLDYRRFC